MQGWRVYEDDFRFSTTEMVDIFPELAAKFPGRIQTSLVNIPPEPEPQPAGGAEPGTEQAEDATASQGGYLECVVNLFRV